MENNHINHMKAIIDRAIPYIKGVLEPFAEVLYIDGCDFTPREVAHADLLIIRTRTRCDKSLLEGSRVRMIATATIGFDHIDLEYCAAHNIRVVTAAGCNAAGVLQWVSATLALLSAHEGWSPNERTLGIVGVGNVGSLVERYAREWGFKVLLCDPPRKQREGGDFLSLEEVAAKADIITFHTPLDGSTHHLIDDSLIDTIPARSVITNASRGEVASTEALLKAPQRLCIDVWENEPAISPALLDKAFVSTPHIAGYSAQGKANASSMVIAAVAEEFSLPLRGWYPTQVTPCPRKPITWEDMCRTIGQHCDLRGESDHLKGHSEDFELIRNTYNYREEYF